MNADPTTVHPTHPPTRALAARPSPPDDAPTATTRAQVEMMNKIYREKKESLKDSKTNKILEKYGGQQHMVRTRRAARANRTAR